MRRNITKKILSLFLVLSLFAGIFGASGASAAPVKSESPVKSAAPISSITIPAEPLDPVDQMIRALIPKDVAIPADLFDVPIQNDSIGTFANDDVPLKGGYSYAHYYAAGGRVDVEVHQLYLNPTDARTYARNSETSIWDGVAWFAASFIPGAGPYLATLGLLQTISDSLFVSSIRQYADYDQSVVINIAKDNWYGTTSRSATYWNGMRSSVKADSSLNPAYLIDSYVSYKYN